MLKDSLNTLTIIETQMGRKLIDQRKQIARELRELNEDPAFDPAQYRRDSSRLLAGYRSDLTTDAASARADMGVDNARVRVAETTANRLYEIEQNAVYRIEQINQTHGGRLTTERTQLEQRINSIARNAGTQRTSDIARQVNAEIAQFSRLANATSNAGGSGKSLQYVFQAQQAVEDFSYAGLRGASNNIALIASQLGGPAGLIALLGITAVQFSSTVAPAMGFGCALDNAKSELEAINGTLAEFVRVDTGKWWTDDVAGIDASTEALKKYQKEIESTEAAIVAGRKS